MFAGLLLKESLEDIKVLEAFQITKTESWNVKDATEFQPNAWTALSFEAEESQADIMAEQLSRSLKSRGWYINAATRSHIYVIFPKSLQVPPR